MRILLLPLLLFTKTVHVNAIEPRELARQGDKPTQPQCLMNVRPHYEKNRRRIAKRLERQARRKEARDSADRMPTVSPSGGADGFLGEGEEEDPDESPGQPSSTLTPFPTLTPSTMAPNPPTVASFGQVGVQHPTVPTTASMDTLSPTRRVIIDSLQPAFDRRPGPKVTVSVAILPIAIQGGTEFHDSSSYQSKALAWLEATSPNGIGTARAIQRYALACIYFATNQVANPFTSAAYGDKLPSWRRSAGWLGAGHECQWAHVACDNGGYVTALALASNSLTGEFPAEIVLLKPTLKILDLGGNVVYTLDERFSPYLGQLTQLTRLAIGSTNFVSTRGVPTELARLTNLAHFRAPNCLYRGPLDPAAFPPSMTQVTYLNLDFNTLGGSVPLEMGQLPALKYLSLRRTSLTGDLSFLFNMPNIVKVWIDRNPGLGNMPLPTEIGSLSTLESLVLSECGFTGTLPTEYGNLSRMKELLLDDNNLGGTIPEEWSALSSLHTLGLQQNSLEGVVPVSLCYLVEDSGVQLFADCDICPVDCCNQCSQEFA